MNRMLKAVDARIVGIFPRNVERAAWHTLESLPDAVIVTDTEGSIRYCNPASQKLLSRGADTLCGRSLNSVFEIVDEVTGKRIDDPVVRCIDKGEVVRLGLQNVLVKDNGERVPVEGSCAPEFGPEQDMTGAVFTLRDVTPSRSLLRELSYRATHDALTRLVNRQEFERRIERVLNGISGRQKHALLFMDMNRFKSVNDTYGHTAGDELLRQTAALFLSKLRDRDTLARLGGDEFGLLLEHCPERRALQVARKLRDALCDCPMSWRSQPFKLDVSIGIVPITAHPRPALEELIIAADWACYAAKQESFDGIRIGSVTNMPMHQKGSIPMRSNVQNCQVESLRREPWLVHGPDTGSSSRA